MQTLSSFEILMPTFFSILSVCSLVIVFFFWIMDRQKLREIMKNQQYYKKLCDELDQNTKIIVQQDLELTRTQESLDKRIHGLYVLHTLSKKMAASLDESVLAKLVCDWIVKELGLEKSAFFLKLRKDSKLLCLGQSGFGSQQIAEQLVPDIEQLLEKNPQKTTALTQLDSFLWTPIEIESTKEGGILAGNSRAHGNVTDDEKDLLGLLADQTAVAIENARLYEQTRATHHLLEARVQERTRELEKLNETLKQVSQMKSDFVSSASHELRTPLTSIQGYSSILISGKLGSVTAEQQARLEKIHRHANELVEMINTLLDISRIERGKTEMKLEPFSLEELILKVEDLLQPQYMSRKIHSKVELPENMDPVLGDLAQLQRVFINLLGNALKYTPEKGTIAILVKSAEKEYQVAVSDTGVGIPQDALPKLFTEFYRVDTPMNQEIKGTGLGLSLVKRIVEAHKGNIWVESQVGKGTTFYFSLPRTPSPAPIGKTDAQEKNSNSG